MNGWIVSTMVMAAVVPAAIAGWAAPRARWPGALAFALLGVAALVTATTSEPLETRPAQVLVVVVCFLAAIVGGGAVTTAVFSLVDAGHAEASASVSAAGEILRGGAWIGALERAAVFILLLQGWPEGLALVLALKGLGRYPELRARMDSGVAERFIIGTFTSVLWAVACAWVALQLS